MIPTSNQELSIAAVREQQSTMMGMLEKMTKRLKNLEEHLATCHTPQSTWRDKDDRAANKGSTCPPVIFHKCRKEGDYARGVLKTTGAN